MNAVVLFAGYAGRTVAAGCTHDVVHHRTAKPFFQRLVDLRYGAARFPENHDFFKTKCRGINTGALFHVFGQILGKGNRAFDRFGPGIASDLRDPFHTTEGTHWYQADAIGHH